MTSVYVQDSFRWFAKQCPRSQRLRKVAWEAKHTVCTCWDRSCWLLVALVMRGCPTDVPGALAVLPICALSRCRGQRTWHDQPATRWIWKLVGSLFSVNIWCFWCLKSGLHIILKRHVSICSNTCFCSFYVCFQIPFNLHRKSCVSERVSRCLKFSAESTIQGTMCFSIIIMVWYYIYYVFCIVLYSTT